MYGRVFKATITLRDKLFLGLLILMSASCVLALSELLSRVMDYISNRNNRELFLFNNADTFISKKLGYFRYEALQIRELCNPRT